MLWIGIRGGIFLHKWFNDSRKVECCVHVGEEKATRRTFRFNGYCYLILEKHSTKISFAGIGQKNYNGFSFVFGFTGQFQSSCQCRT